MAEVYRSERRARYQEVCRQHIQHRLRGEFGTRGRLDSETMAYTDKVKPEMVFVEINRGGAETLVVSALHELVHWVSHPPLQGHRITAWGFLDDGLGEGLTQVVTEDIFEDQELAGRVREHHRFLLAEYLDERDIL